MPNTYYIYDMQAWNVCDAETGLSLKGTNQSLILRRTKEYSFMGLLNPTNIPYKSITKKFWDITLQLQRLLTNKIYANLIL